MCEQTEIDYLDGEVVWVKLGSCWWPGEVIGADKLPPDVLPSFRKPPIAVVKFFQEDKYEYVRNISSIYKYNCSRKDEFIKKGLDVYRSKHGLMEKFPEDIIRAETATNGDIEILTRDEFQEMKKESYAGLFGDTGKKTPANAKKGKGSKAQHPFTSTDKTPQRLRFNKANSDYKVHILVQGSKSSSSSQLEEIDSRASTSQADSPEVSDSYTSRTQTVSMPTTISNSGVYSCHACPFTTTRLNIMIHHNKTHSTTYVPYTPSPVRKKPIKTTPKSTKITSISKTPKPRKPRKEKSRTKTISPPQALKRAAEEKASDMSIKKIKTDEEIKSSLLADWDDVDEELPEELLSLPADTSPEVPIPSESASVPTLAESSIPELSTDALLDAKKKSVEPLPSTTEKPNSASDSKYEFCEDEDWPLEADAGRKIPRVKNSSKKKPELQSGSIDEDDVAREVAELLDKTTVPELPSAPESLKVEENFPELPIAKSPDKIPETSSETLSVGNIQINKNVSEVQQKKTIFKTKTFFRSRHSRSQDAIGKYVAEQLNAAERMDTSESEINGTESVPSPEMRESPPADHVKVARLAPKIQLKKMKAEAQLREKINTDFVAEDNSLPTTASQDINDTLDSHALQDENVESDSQIKHIDHIHTEEKIITVDNSSIDEYDPGKSNINAVTETQIETNSNLSEKLKEPHVQPVSQEKNTLKLDSVTTNITLLKSKSETELHYINETTASAVDALLSVSRDADRVTKMISNDVPEDLFEDDKDVSIGNTMNGLDGKNNLSEGDINSIKVENNDSEHLSKANEPKVCPKKLDICEQLQHEYDNIDKDSNDVISTNNTKIEDSNIIASKNDTDIEDSNNTANKNDTIIEHSNDIKNDTKIYENTEQIKDSTPTESDLQIAETLINLPSTALQNKINKDVESLTEFSMDVDTTDGFVMYDMIKKNPDSQESVAKVISNVEIETSNDDENIKEPLESNELKSEINNVHFESEQEKTDNLNAAQSLVQMSETLDHNGSNNENNVNNPNATNSLDIEDKIVLKGNDLKNHNNIKEETVAVANTEQILNKNNNCDRKNSKLLKILEEPCIPKVKEKVNKILPQKQIIVQNKEKILNFDVSKSPLKNTPQSPKQKIIIRRTNSNKNLINCLNDASQEKIILSRSNKSNQDGVSVPTYTIQASPDISSDSNTIIIQQKLRKIPNTPKLQKIKPQSSLINISNTKADKGEEALFDINSMPIVLSDDILTPESIEKMPIVMTDGNVISAPQKMTKTKPTILLEKEKQSSIKTSNKPDIKTLLMSTVTESGRMTTPNIISKTSKLKASKPMLVIDKLTGKQRIIMPKSETIPKETKMNTPKLVTGQPATKTEKFIILPSSAAPRATRPQKIVIDPQSGKAHVLIGKASETAAPAADNKPVSAKLIPTVSDATNPGSTVMIITDAQGAQSRILLTSEHEKLLFPNKPQTITQIKTVPQRQTIVTAVQKTHVIAAPPLTPVAKAQTKIIPKQKGAIITSKGQLIVGGRVASKTTQSVTLPEIRPAVPKRIISSEPNKVTQTVKKSAKTEPLIFLQQKSGAVMQLTAAQFEHLQRTGQIVHKTPVQMQPVMQENKIVVQKTVTVASSEPVVPLIQKQKGRAIRPLADSPAPVKKAKPHEMLSITPLTPIHSKAVVALAPAVVTTTTTPSPATSAYPELDNFEELLPSTAIARQPEQSIAPLTTPVTPAPVPVPVPPLVPAIPSPTPATPPTQLSDGPAHQLLAVPGEHFGGPPGSFFLCIEDNGTLTPIDNRPLVLENNQLVPMAVEPVLAAPERRDILEAALANSDVFHAEAPRDEPPDFRDLNVNVSVHCRVSETSTTLNQPIMTPVEVPTKVDGEPAVAANLEDGLAVIGVTPSTVPTSLDLPITVTDPRIAPKITDPLGVGAYGTTFVPSPSAEMTYVTAEETVSAETGSISMPLLTEEDDGVGKSMPILTDELGERAASSVESAAGSPSSLESGGWSRRLLTPASDTSDNSAEIPLQPAIQLSVNDIDHAS